MASRQEQIRLHHQKWKRWKMQMKTQKSEENTKRKDDKFVESASTYAAKIMGKLKEQTKLSDCPISKNFEKQFESNACSVCYQLMIPPRSPITLFPCGHNMCKVCLFNDGHKKLKTYSLKTKYCGLCGQDIKNYAENRSLMNLICTYTDNKHLIQKQDVLDIEEQYEEKAGTSTVDNLKLRCDILTKEKKSVALALAKERKNKEIVGEVLAKLLEQKKNNNREMQALEEETKLIENFLQQKRDELQRIKLRIATTEQKKRVVQKTLQPLRTQKQKLQILEAAKLVQK